MLSFLKTSLHDKKVQREGVIFFLFFLVIYSMVDYLNMSYVEMMHSYGLYLVISNILINVIMALGSAFLMVLAQVMIKIKAIEPKGTKLGFLSVFFGIMTYGCTSCVIALLANIGITYSVLALPLAGLPYKFVSLLLIGVGIGWSLYDINRGACNVNIKGSV